MQRFQPADEADFRWYHREAEASFGLRSNFYLMLELGEYGRRVSGKGGSGRGYDPQNDVAVEACRRWRRVTQALRETTPETRRLIRWSFGLPPLPNTWKTMAWLSGAALLTPTALRGYRSRQKKVVRELDSRRNWISLGGNWMYTKDISIEKPSPKRTIGFPKRRSESLQWWLEDICSHALYTRGDDPEHESANAAVTAMRLEALQIYKSAASDYYKAVAHAAA